ncbi:cytochrome P450 [Paraburkholderia phymatum]|uniref:cytochrome P450 n=1 Tax=Paraburkholderia phymatum TaxID=148447 RepID=UPI0031712143
MVKTSGPVTLETLPRHVSKELVRPFPFPLGRATTDNPYRTLIPELIDGPAAFYTLDGYHGMGPLWVFRRLQDIEAIYLDTEHFSNRDFAPFAELEGGNWNLVPAESDPPLHTFHRSMMNPLFTPKRMAAVDASIRKMARDVIEDFKDKGECDFVRDMALRYPIAVFLGLMDLPMSRIDQFLDWEFKLIHPKSIAEAREATIAVVAFLRELIGQRRLQPGDDLVSYAISADVQGRGLDENELLGFCFNLFIGGLDTVSTNLGWQVRHLAEHPKHQAALRQNPAQIPDAIEELLRAYAAVTTNRRCIKETTINGIKLMPGDMIALPTPLANNDPEAFDEPQTVKLDRKPRHLSFGGGVHRCLGAALARRELVIGLTELLAALPPFRVADGAVITSHIAFIIQLENLPLVWSH